MEVPIIVTLAECKSPVSSILALTTGSIIEFETPADSELKLLVANKCIGTGQAVKVGENFGLRITRVGAVDDCIKALGPQ
jgi:flagellar motor switch protein FliN/FliY